jgi:F0F1-type ATP synthase delta subunit
MSLLLLVLAAQIIVGLAVALVLKKVLDAMLIDLAMKHLQMLRREESSRHIGQAVVTSFKPLKAAAAARMRRAVAAALTPAAAVEFCVDRKLWGGVVIRAGEHVLDFSLRDRLKKAF